MKKNYTTFFLILISLFSGITSISAADFFNNGLKSVSGITPTESFYTEITTLPFEPTDGVDMSNSTLAPSVYFPIFTASYPTVGYKVTLASAGTLTLNASSETVPIGNFAFYVFKDLALSSSIYFNLGNGTSKNLDAGTYYICLITNNKYGKFEVSISSSASVVTEIESLDKNQIQLYSENGAIIVSGMAPNSDIKIYSISGELMENRYSSDQKESFQLPVKGVYIVNINGLSKKVVVK